MNKTEKLIKFLKENPECVDKLADALLDKEPELVPWDASMGEHWYITDGAIWYSSGKDMKSLVAPYCFKIQEDAKQMRDYLKVIYKLRMQTKGFVPDWGNIYSKYFLTYSHSSDSIFIGSYGSCNFGSVYFQTVEDAQAAADSLTPEEIETFKRGWPVIPMVEKKG